MHMKHLLSIDSLTNNEIEEIFSLADKHSNSIPYHSTNKNCGRFISVFFEDSTRTRLSFESAALDLGYDIINVDVNRSSIKKGETIRDTAEVLDSYGGDIYAIRHSSSGAVSEISKYINSCVINAGDGMQEHPSQALIDLYTLQQRFGKDLTSLRVCIFGDILHSRVARSVIKLFKRYGIDISIVTVPTMAYNEFENCKVFYNIYDVIDKIDVCMLLRIQKERIRGGFINSLNEYRKFYSMNRKVLHSTSNNILIMHPGPVNRDIELEGSIADDVNISIIRSQIRNGVMVRAGIINFLRNTI